MKVSATNDGEKRDPWLEAWLKAFGMAVKLRRVELGMSQERLAGEGQFARSFVAEMERGQKAASVTSICRLAAILNCKPSDLWLTAERLHENPPKKAPAPRKA